MNFQEVVMARHAAKNFNGKKIPKDKMEQFYELIRFAPSSFNMQPWKIKIIEDDVALKQQLQAASWNQPQVTSCSHFLVFCADSNLEKLQDRLASLMTEGGVPETKVKNFMGMLRPFMAKLSLEKKESWAMRQVYIALGNAMNAAKALGFDSCPMEGLETEQYAKILNLPSNLTVGAALAVGYCDEAPRSKLRFKKEEIFF